MSGKMKASPGSGRIIGVLHI